jgi:hypothetical protein
MITKTTAECWLRHNNWTQRWIGVEADPWVNPDITREEVTVYHQIGRYRTYQDLLIEQLARAYKVSVSDIRRTLA